MLVQAAEARLPTKFGLFSLYVFQEDGFEIPVLTQLQHLKRAPLLRIHSSCLTGDVFHSLRCDCGEQLAVAMQRIQQEGGILIYLPQEGRGIGLTNKIKAYALQDNENLDTVEANIKLGLPVDAREYQKVAEILNTLEITECILLTNNPLKIKALNDYGIKVQRESLTISANIENKNYLTVKHNKLGHLL